MKRFSLIFLVCAALCAIAGSAYADDSGWIINKTTDAFGKIKRVTVETTVEGYRYRSLDSGQQPCSAHIIAIPSRQVDYNIENWQDAFTPLRRDSVSLMMTFTPKIMFNYGNYITIGLMSGDDFAELEFQCDDTYTSVLVIPSTIKSFDFLRILSSGGTVKIGITLAAQNMMFDVDVSDFAVKLAEARAIE
jgi:hypothetical protein